MKLGNLAARVLTAVLLVPGIVAAILWERHEAVWGLVFAATLIALHEYFTIVLEDEIDRWAGILFGAGLAAAVYWYAPSAAIALPAMVIVPALWYLFRFGNLETVWPRLGATTFGLGYAGLLLTFLALLKRDGGAHGGSWVLVVLMIAWLGDTGAYFAGRFLGKRKLYPAISPGKTWAGALGGVAGSYLTIVLANLWFFPELGWVHGSIVAIVGSVLGQTGDLVESMLKRARGVKDSGRLLPGHGGMLDRIDAVIFIAPWTYLYLVFLWR
jgi:phosphatidate cytidylyltransferase